MMKLFTFSLYSQVILEYELVLDVSGKDTHTHLKMKFSKTRISSSSRTNDNLNLKTPSLVGRALIRVEYV